MGGDRDGLAPDGAVTTGAPKDNDMQIRLADTTLTAVLQLRDAIRRATATHLPADGRNERDFLAGVDVTDSTLGEWEDTNFDVRWSDA